MPCANISLQLWMAVVFLIIGLILHLVSFSAPYWNQVEDQHWGLWQFCDGHGCETISNLHEISNTMQVGRGCQMLGLVCYVTVAVLVVLHMIFKETGKGITWSCDLRLLTTAVLVAFFALFLILIGSVLWSTGSNTTLYWCYYLCYFSGLAAASTGGVLIYVRRQELMATIEKTQAIEI